LKEVIIMKTLDSLFMEIFADIKLRIYAYHVDGTRWILNQFVRDQVMQLRALTRIACDFCYINDFDRFRIDNMVLASCDRMLQDLDKQEADL